MSKDVVKTLEFDKVLEQLKSHAVSEIGKEKIEALSMISDRKQLEQAQAETSEATHLLVRRSTPPLIGIRSITEAASFAARGGQLTMRDLLDVSDFLRGARQLKDYMKSDDGDERQYPIIENLIGSLWSYQTLEREINRCIISEEEMADNASSKLRSIRSSMKSRRDSVREKLNHIVSSSQYESILQDSIITMREGRYVVPVKSDSRGALPGLVHDMSSSGQTAYIEPMSVVELNNELRGLEIEEREEIERILQELSQQVGRYPEEIEANEAILQELDFIFAKGKLALEQNAVKPIFNDEKYIKLIDARHPLIPGDEVVPIQLELGRDYTSLIVTGPNTGGKTVSLKTLGLMVMMAQSGLHIPAREKTEIGIFKNIYADIGDEQSIEQSLSTFSSHMVNIIHILENMDEESLVLFDELGAGTDPTEGAALALSIMEMMRERKIRTMATTHYNQLKVYALTHDGVQNASMQFDVETLSPTYKLIIGIPGKSNAFEISTRLGLSEDVIDRAKNYIATEDIEFEEVLAAIEKERSYLERQRAEMAVENNRLKKKQGEYERELRSVRNQRERMIKEAEEKALQIVRQARQDVSLAVSEIKDVNLILEGESARRLQDAQDILREGEEELSRNRNKGLKLKTVKNPAQNLKPGETVYAESLGVEVTVLEIDKKKKEALVQAGLMKVTLPVNTLKRREAEKEAVSSRRSKNLVQEKQKSIQTEIDIRGQNFHEAQPVVDKYIDDAVLTGVKQISIIHGKGTGALRKKVRDHLKKHKSVKSIEEAAYDEGGSGVTKVILK